MKKILCLIVIAAFVAVSGCCVLDRIEEERAFWGWVFADDQSEEVQDESR